MKSIHLRMLCIALVVALSAFSAAAQEITSFGISADTTGGGWGGVDEYGGVSVGMFGSFTVGTATFSNVDLEFGAGGAPLLSETHDYTYPSDPPCISYESIFGSGGDFSISSLAYGLLISGTIVSETAWGFNSDCPMSHHPGSLDGASGSVTVTWANPQIFGNGIASGGGTFWGHNFGDGAFSVGGQVTTIPEPSSLLLLATGLLGSIGMIKRAPKR